MKKKFAKRFLSWVMAAAMVISMLPLSAMAAEGDVAQIGGTTYPTLEAALKAATDSADSSVTIEMLESCTITDSIAIPEGKTFTLTADADAGITITDTERKGMRPNGSLIMENITFITNGQIALNGTTSEGPFGREITFRNVTLKMDGENHVFNNDGYYCTAIFADAPALFVFDDCDVEIKNYDIHNNGGAALRWNGKLGDTGYGVEIINGTTFTSSGCYSGFVGTLDLLVKDSTLNVLNHSGNGSNGTNYTIENSTVNFNGNGSHGLSAGSLTVTGSTINAIENGMCGIIATGKTEISNSTVNIQKNKVAVNPTSAWSRPGALTLKGESTISADSNVTITDNAGSGIYLWTANASLNMQSGTVMNNRASATGGGGIYNQGSCTLSENVKLYNNHSEIAGDDIYNDTSENKSATITFGKVGSDWVLDDCEHMIDGWYDDSEGTRWAVHPDGNNDGVLEEDSIHADKFTDFGEAGLATVTGLTALKAAHGAKFEDKTSYPGLTKDVSDLNDEKNWQEEDKAVDVAAGNTVNFKLTSNVPDDLRNYLKPEDVYPPVIEGEPEGTPAPGVPVDENRGSYTLTFHDVMDEMLTNPDSFVVTIGKQDSETIPLLTLTENTHYTINTKPEAHKNEDGTTTTCSFEITLDLAKLYADQVITNAYIDNAAPITVTYQATLSEDAVSGQFENKAWVTAPNWKTSEDVVYVNTYAINIYKYKQGESETGLSGAVFELKLGDKVIKNDITSGENGHVVVGGLDKGNYTLTETKAPEGYVCSETPLEIKVPDNATNYVVNVSFANSLIPHTGGMGTTLFSIVGGALIVTAGVVFFVSRRKKSHTA